MNFFGLTLGIHCAPFLALIFLTAREYNAKTVLSTWHGGSVRLLNFALPAQKVWGAQRSSEKSGLRAWET